MSATLTADEIKDIRLSYGLTQKSFATLLGIGPASIARYETGSKPSKANANLIRAARIPEFMKECLESDGELIPEPQRQNAKRVVYAVIELPTLYEIDEATNQEVAPEGDNSAQAQANPSNETPGLAAAIGVGSSSEAGGAGGEAGAGGASGEAEAAGAFGGEPETGGEIVDRMTQRYELTLRQEVLNEQAANLIGQLISLKVKDGFTGKVSEVFSSLLDDLARLKPQIIFADTHSKLDQLAGYIECAQDLMNQQVRSAA